MTFEVGDKGQRYEVRYSNSEGIEKIVGWTELKSDANSMCKGIKLHPAFHSPKIIDRQKLQES